MKTKLAAIVCAMALGVIHAAPANASVIYSYTGNAFSQFLDTDPPAGSYDSSMSVTGTFTVPAALLSLPLSDISSSVSSFSFSDGRQVLDDGNSFINAFSLSTDADGSPLGWAIAVATGFPVPTTVGDVNRVIQTDSSLDIGTIFHCASPGAAPGTCGSLLVDVGASTAPGSWFVSSGPVAIPEPSSLAVVFLGLGLIGVGVLVRRRSAAPRD